MNDLNRHPALKVSEAWKFTAQKTSNFISGGGSVVLLFLITVMKHLVKTI